MLCQYTNRSSSTTNSVESLQWVCLLRRPLFFLVQSFWSYELQTCPKCCSHFMSKWAVYHFLKRKTKHLSISTELFSEKFWRYHPFEQAQWLKCGHSQHHCHPRQVNVPCLQQNILCCTGKEQHTFQYFFSALTALQRHTPDWITRKENLIVIILQHTDQKAMSDWTCSLAQSSDSHTLEICCSMHRSTSNIFDGRKCNKGLSHNRRRLAVTQD